MSDEWELAFERNIIAGSGINIDNTNPLSPIISATGGGGSYTPSTSILLNGTSFERAALTGDVTASQNSNATTISNSAVTNAKMANMNANTFKGRLGTTGAPENLTVTQVNNALGTALKTDLPTTNGQFMVGNGTGQTFRTITGQDLGITFSGGALYTPIWSPNTGWYSGIRVDMAASASSIVQRESTGRIAVAAGLTSGHAVNMGQLDLKADDNAVVKLTGNQTIAGTKTFSTSPIVPSKSTPAGNNPTVLATEAQVFAISGSVGTLQDVIDASVVGGNVNAVFPSGTVLNDDGNDGLTITAPDERKLTLESTEGGIINLDFNGVTFSIPPSKGGAKYAQDYSANFTERSLVDKEYVDNQIEIYLKSLPSYNASTPQVLGHDASGNIQWQTP